LKAKLANFASQGPKIKEMKKFGIPINSIRDLIEKKLRMGFNSTYLSLIMGLIERKFYF